MHHTTYLAPPIFTPLRTRGRVVRLGVAAALLGLQVAAFAQTPKPAASTPTATTGTVSATGTQSASDQSKLDADLFYQLLLGELNARGGEPGTGFSLVLDAARKTNDPQLFERAVDIAIQGRSGDAALQAARAWAQAQPKSALAHERLFQVLVALNRMPESVEPLRNLLANTPAAERAVMIERSVATYARVSDKKLAANTAEQALVDYLNPSAEASLSSPAWSSVGRLRLAAKDTTGALEAARKSQAANARNDSAAILALEMMEPKQTQAESIVTRYLATDKPRVEIRMAYARNLLDAQRYAEAGQQITQITRDKPDFAEAWLVQGTLQLQDNQLANADTSLKRYLSMVQQQSENADPESDRGQDRQRGLTQAYLALSQLAEKRKDFPLAESWIAKIDSPQALVSTQNRRASILAKQGKMDEARKLIRNLPERSEADKRTKILSEVQLLRDNKQYAVAYDLMAQAVSSFPQDPELLYDQATLAEKLERFAEMERLLRQLIAAKPDYQQAYNALGYSFAERNIRLPEAKQLIQKALELTPGDPYITDSLGWVEFRMGNKAEAIKILQTAYQGKPDAEIAAHLGEVYLANGQRDKAIAIWKEGMLLNNENDTLLETLKRLRIKL
jgi:tetratricopeptide (TPR) repeat protein